MPQLPDDTYRCQECHDRNWVTVENPDSGVASKPCRRCNPMMYARWVGGHLSDRCPQPCRQCNGIRSGAITIYDCDAEGILPDSPLLG